MDIDRPGVIAAVRGAFETYVIALNDDRQEFLDLLFWNDPRVVRFGASSNQRGIDEIRAFRSARGPHGAKIHCYDVKVTAFGPDVAAVNALFRRGDRADHIGRWSQVWIRMPDGWCIAAAHASEIADPDAQPPKGHG